MPADKDPAAKNPNSKFAATLSELESALQAWDESVRNDGEPSTTASKKPETSLYDTKLIKDLCRQLRELSKD